MVLTGKYQRQKWFYWQRISHDLRSPWCAPVLLLLEWPAATRDEPIWSAFFYYFSSLIFIVCKYTGARNAPNSGLSGKSEFKIRSRAESRCARGNRLPAVFPRRSNKFSRKCANLPAVDCSHGFCAHFKARVDALSQENCAVGANHQDEWYLFTFCAWKCHFYEMPW